ncbi:uncharacterized protein LOC128963777 [Oppia nitens]|uniref:uncharacterized protein LOC128963777 n=1 Tax=Oppia nitens TaxID=1686743 RepID=UPI0023DCC141|nr:uncharacterized protein LOC128963777 [Oppia nitens]
MAEKQQEIDKLTNSLTKQLKIETKQQITLLLLGESGVGKSTFINAFVNYLFFDKMSDAVNRAFCLIPAKFTLTDPKTKKRKLMTFGVPTNTENTEKTTESATQYPRCYTFDLGDHQLNIIDTPGIADTKGLDKDNQNMQNILNFISHYSVINGICVLLKPNEARVGVIFKYCILELLCHLSKSAANNIMFVFTNARGTFYEPGDTAAALEDVLTQVRQRPPNVEIRFDENNTFCFDNESFRYLVAVSEPNNMVFNKNVETDYETSWSRSVDECQRMMTYICKIKPHNVMDTLSINDAKRTIKLLTQPMADISKNIADNLKECQLRTQRILHFEGNIKDLMNELYIPVIDIASTPLTDPRTVCSDNNCCESENIDGNVVKHYKTVCHWKCYLKYDDGNVIGNRGLLDCQAFNEYKQTGPDRQVRPEDANLHPDNSCVADPVTGLITVHYAERIKHDYCQTCGHSYMVHLHVNYETRKIKTKRRDEAKYALITSDEEARDAQRDKVNELMDRQKLLAEESKIINECMAMFAVFLKHNALTPFNDAFMDYVEHLIRDEEQNNRLVSGVKQQSVKQLKDMLEQYKHERDSILDAMKKGDNYKTVTLEDIDNCVNRLNKLPINGKKIQELMQMQLTISNKIHHHADQHVIKVNNDNSIVKYTKNIFKKIAKNIF